MDLALENRYKTAQQKYLALHCGQFLPYLDDYRGQFQLEYEDLLHIYNDLLSRYVSITLSDMELELSDAFELIETLMDEESTPADEIIDQFEKQNFEILTLGESVKTFLFDLLKMAIDEDLMHTYSLEIVSGISEKSAVFDKKVLKYIDHLIESFINERNNKRLAIGDQRSLFQLQYEPKIERLVKTSFTLELSSIHFPIFMELLLMTTIMEMERPKHPVDYQVFLLLENPNTVPLENVGITFFVPNSFRIKTRIMEIGKIKPHQKIRTSTNVIPTVEGRFYIMAMVQYEHTKESFWMPTIKQQVTVGHPEKHEEVFRDIYKKYGVDIDMVEHMKLLEATSQAYEDSEARKQFPKDEETVEKDSVADLIHYIDEFEEEEIKGDSEVDFPIEQEESSSDDNAPSESTDDTSESSDE